jgi:hypothetical protein
VSKTGGTHLPKRLLKKLGFGRAAVRYTGEVLQLVEDGVDGAREEHAAHQEGQHQRSVSHSLTFGDGKFKLFAGNTSALSESLFFPVKNAPDALSLVGRSLAPDTIYSAG